MNVLRSFIRKTILEVSRNYHTLDPSPITFHSFSDYDIEINPAQENYSVTVKFDGNIIYGPQAFSDYEEANNNARRIVDSHRVSVMNSNRLKIS